VGRILELKECEATNLVVEELKTGSSADLDVNSIRVLHAEKDIPAQIGALEDQLNARIAFLYECADEASNYDEWLASKEAERGTLAEEIRRLIAGDETGTVEFKETLEFVDRVPAAVPPDRQAQWKAEKQKECVLGVLKTICAFYNSKGGTLLIGVSDQKQIIGLAPDFSMLGQKKDKDGFGNKLMSLLKKSVSPLPSDIDVDFPELDGKTICRVQVPASRTPHWCDDRLFIRFGNTTEELTGSKLKDWLDKRGRDLE
jgi:hypothetical protein